VTLGVEVLSWRRWHVDMLDPRRRGQEDRRLERELRIWSQSFGETAPGPVLRALYQAGAQSIALDVSANPDKLGGPSDRF
jgi:hypothetical protein